jgi:hypothetical protein
LLLEDRYRPPGQPHFGGIVERLIGTMMQMVHELPGTTFSSTADRGSYDSSTRAVMTLGELRRWLALAVACYAHGLRDRPRAVLLRRAQAVDRAPRATESVLRRDPRGVFSSRAGRSSRQRP